MAEVHGLTLEVGRMATVGLVSSLVSDIDVVAQSALELATHVARSEADGQMMAIMRAGGVRGLVDEARSRELPGSDESLYRDFEELERDLHALRRYLLPTPKRPQTESLLISSMALWSGSALSWSRLIDRFRADEMSRRLPREPYRFRSISYQNPLAVEIITAIGASAASLSILLKIIRDWEPRRRLQNAIAEDREDQVKCRIKLRQILLAKVASGELPISPDAVDGLVSGRLPAAIDRLSDHEPEVRESEDTDEDLDE